MVPAAALRCAQIALGQAGALGISSEWLRWAWPLAARAAHDLADTATTAELLALLDGYAPENWPPCSAPNATWPAPASPSAATQRPRTRSSPPRFAGLRQHSTPYHLAHGLLDYAEYLTRRGDTEAAEQAIGEARGIADRLRCQPLLDRADTSQPASPRTTAS